ncbi:MAG TPA: DNA methyltransferase, partial [Gemmataceae bacterium]|nr:DNA methyltransferase [Gemmataceae bacterium]
MTSESQEQGTDRVIARLEPACRLLAEARIHPWPEMQAMLPPLSRAQRAALEASIAADGVLQLVFVLPDGRIVDGANRWDIAPDQCRIEVVERSDEDALALGLALNLARRQLTAEQIAEVHETLRRDRALRRKTALELRSQGLTQGEVAARVGVAQQTVSDWEDADGESDTENGIPFTPAPFPDCRVTIPRPEYPTIAERIRNGESRAQVAADYGVTSQRIGQIATMVEARHQAPELSVPDLPTILCGERCRVEQADCLDWLAKQPADSIDLIFGSPPYEQARLYLENGENLGVARDTDTWVAWMVEVYRVASRCCKGVVAFVVEGQTTDYSWSAAPAILMAELRRVGITLRKPPLYHRVGIPGSGGPDWLRNDYEFCVCATRGGRLPWSNNTAMGKRPPEGRHPRRATNRKQNGDRKQFIYQEPEICNPGNIIRCAVGGGNMGDELCHENEAPFPEALVEFFVRSFCPPGGIVADPFCGSGSTGKVALACGRTFLGCDVRACESPRQSVHASPPPSLRKSGWRWASIGSRRSIFASS